MNVKVERSVSLTVASPHSIYPPSSVLTLLYIFACMQHQSVTASTSTASHHNTKDRRLCPSFFLPLCLPFAVIVTLLDVSLKQDAHIPLSLPDFSSIYHSRLCLCRVLFSNAKPPLGAERVNGAHAAQGVAQ